MAAPTWLSVMFAGVMLAITVYCGGRLITAAAWRRESELDADGMHLFMGVAMAGGLAPQLSVLAPGVWETVFALTAAWFAWQVLRVRRAHSAGRWRCPHPVPHLAESLAMVYMMAAPARAPASGSGSAGAAMPGMGGAPGMARFPVVAVMLALFMVGYVAWLGDRLISVSRAAAAAGRGGAAELASVQAAPGHATAGGTGAAAAGASGSASGQYTPAACGASPAPQAGRRWPVLAPRAATCYKIVMGITMAYMLIIMV